MKSAMRNLHVPLPETVHQKLKAEANRTGVAATKLARTAIEDWLSEAQRTAIAEDIARYARDVAGSTDDLDPGLEAAGVEHLLEIETRPGRKRR